MDAIVRQIYEAIETEEFLKSTLLVLCGDHGMNDAGNHGGSSPGETSPALVFISPKLKNVAPGLRSPATFNENFQTKLQSEANYLNAKVALEELTVVKLEYIK